MQAEQETVEAAYRSRVQPVGAHEALPFDGLLARAASDALAQVRSLPDQQLSCGFGHLDPVLQAAALHARCHIHSVTKQAVAWVHIPNY